MVSLALINLSPTSKNFEIDDIDFNLVSQYTWFLDSDGYPVAHIRGKTKSIMILLVGKGYDHKDRNPLNNKRTNLRKASRTQNNANRGLCKIGCTSKYREVNLKDGRWRATVSYQHRQLHIGCYDTELDAARAYNKYATIYYGEFATLNEV